MESFGEAGKTANEILCVHLSIQNPVLGPAHSVVNKMSIVPPSFHSSLQGTHHVQGAVLAWAGMQALNILPSF